MILYNTNNTFAESSETCQGILEFSQGSGTILIVVIEQTVPIKGGSKQDVNSNRIIYRTNVGVNMDLFFPFIQVDQFVLYYYS